MYYHVLFITYIMFSWHDKTSACGGVLKIGSTPIAGMLLMEHPTEMHDSRGALF